MDNAEFGQGVLDRLAKLERAHRRSRVLNLTLFLVLTVALVSGQAAPTKIPDEIKARRLVAVDAQGKDRAVLEVDLGNEPALKLNDENGTLRATLYMFHNEPKFILSDQNGKFRASVNLSRNGSPMLYLSDRNEKIRASLSVLPNGSPALEFTDQNDKCRVNVSLLAKGGPSMTFYDQRERPRAELCLLADGSPRLDLSDAENVVIWKAPAD